MQRLAEHLGGGADLDDPPGIHDRHLGDQPADDREVVADVDRRHPVGAAQAPDGVQDVALGGDVEAGRRLVEHDQPTSRQQNAMARPIRCCWPPDSWCG